MFWRERAYEVLPALSVRRRELRLSMRLVTLGFIYAMFWVTFTNGSHVKVFSRMVGFNDFAFGVMSALPFLATFGQLIAAILIERTGLRKFQFLGCLTPSRLLWLAVMAIPLVMPVPSQPAVVMMLVVLAASWLLSAMGTPAWLTWMGDLIPRRVRGRYFATRDQIGRLVQLPVVIVLGYVLDVVTRPDAPETAADQPLLLYVICGIFALGAVLGACDILLYRRIREVLPTERDRPRRPAILIDVPPPRRRTPARLVGYSWRYTVAAFDQLLVDPLRDRLFRRYILYGATITFAAAVGGWYYWLFCLDTLGFSKLSTNMLYLVIAQLAAIFSCRPWGKLVDRWGRRPVLMLATGWVALAGLPYFFCHPSPAVPAWVLEAVRRVAGAAGAVAGRPDWANVTDQTPIGAWLMLIFATIVGGSGWVGINLAQTNVILGFADGEGRSKYVAASSVLISLGGILGGVVGGIVAQSLEFLQTSPLQVGPFLWNNWQATFALSAVARIAALLCLIGMPDPGAAPVLHVLRQIGVNVYNALASPLFMPLRVFGWRKGRDRSGGEGK